MKLDYLGEAYFQNNQHFGAFLFGNRGICELKNENIVLWGTGELAQRCVSYLDKHNVIITAFCDNNSKLWNSNYLGRSIISPSDTWSKNNYIIICAQNLNLWNIARQVSVRHGDDFACFFTCSIGDFFDVPILMDTVISSMNILLHNELYHGNINKWYQFIDRSWQLGHIIQMCISTQCWDSTLIYIFKSMSKRNISCKLLDIGPGWGLYSLILNKLYNRLYTTWCCYSDEHNEEDGYIDFEHKHHKVNRIFGNVENTAFELSDKYDIILLTEVFEHFQYNPVVTLRKIVNWLSPNGILALTTPTPEYDSTKIYDSYKQLPDYTNEPIGYHPLDAYTPSIYFDKNTGHTYIYSKDELNEIFSACGLENIHHKTNKLSHQVILRRKK